MRFQIGDRVLIHHESLYVNQNKSRSKVYQGTVTGKCIDGRFYGNMSRTDFQYRVKWDHHEDANYNDIDLVPANVKNNKEAMQMLSLDEEW